uniref:BED-type domain-containing protein n=1 Tax=Globisporangium ultimum (strain ATCC 200006 / CBS 805.95 / DAOM BR144) TaxID=431595 RepID=K3WUH0_GLOUD
MSNGVAHGELTLFDCPRVRRSEYWQFIRLVAPRRGDGSGSAAAAPPAGQTHWLSQDATDAFCLKCHKMFRFLKGSSNSVRRHMERFHMTELLQHRAQFESAKARKTTAVSTLCGTASAGSSSSYSVPPKALGKAAKRLHASPHSVLMVPSPSAASFEKQLPSASDHLLLLEGAAPVVSNGNSSATSTTNNSSKKRRAESSFGSFEQRNASELLVKWLCRNMRSLSIVQEPGFADFVEYISGHAGVEYTLPSLEALQHRLESMAENARFEVKQRVKKEGSTTHFALSVDVWRTHRASKASNAAKETRANPELFLALSCHFLNTDFVRSTWTLDVIAARGRSGSDVQDDEATDALAEKLNSMLRTCGLQRQLATLCYLADDASDTRLPRAATRLGLHCFPDMKASLERILSHDTGLVRATLSTDGKRTVGVSREIDVNKPSAVENERWLHDGGACGVNIARALKELHTLAHGLKAHAGVAEKLQQIHNSMRGAASENDVPKLSLHVCKTWTDVADFLTLAVLLQPCIDLLFRDGASSSGSEHASRFSMELAKPSVQTWFIAEALLLVLRPFHELNDVLATEKRGCSLPFVLPCISMTRQELRRENLFSELTAQYLSPTSDDVSVDVIQELHAFRDFVLRAFEQKYDEICDELQWCAALDPRYGRLRHMSEEDRELCKVALVERAMELFVSQLPPLPPPAASSELLMSVDFEGDIMYGVVGRTPAPAPAAVVQGGGLMHRLLYDDEEEVVGVAPASSGSPEPLSRDAEIAQTRAYVTNEVSMYVSEHQVRKTRISCPLQWWQANRERYPFLAPLARLWLGTVASSPLQASPSLVRHVIPPELCEESPSHSWQKATADMLFLHTTIRHANRTEASISL